VRRGETFQSSCTKSPRVLTMAFSPFSLPRVPPAAQPSMNSARTVAGVAAILRIGGELAIEGELGRARIAPQLR